jgi:histidinol-phosphate aminotransferase
MNIPRPRPAIAAMSGYTPGEQPAVGLQVIKLNTNENPYPPSPRAMAVIHGFEPEALRRYPNPTGDMFRDAVAALHGTTREQVIAGNGSDDILAIVLRTYVGPGETIAWPDPTYSLYPVLAELAATKGVGVPWAAGWSLPSDGLLATGARAIFFANPNAPSGTLVTAAEVRALAERFSGIVLVDEAYADFADSDCVSLLGDCPNVVISRTLSKGYGLCGLRLGYALAAPEIIAELMKVKDSYNCNALAIAAGKAAIEDRAYAQGTWNAVRVERARMTSALESRGWHVIPSQANFLLATAPAGNAAALYGALKQRGIFVRHFDKPGLQDKLRFSIGRPDENDALLSALAELTAAT